MKAIRVLNFGGPEVMTCEQIPDPEPGPGEVLIRVHAAGVNPLETYIRSGLYPVKPALPYTPGTDAAGVVLKAGKSSQNFSPGTRVYTAGSVSGTYAEMTICRIEDVYRLPEQLTSSQGAGIGIPYATAYRALFRHARAVPGETVLVHGASGGVGVAAVQIACAMGLTVIGTAGTEKGRMLVMEQGAHYAVDHSDEGHFDDILEMTQGRGVDIILEMLADVNLGRDLSVAAFQGRIVVIGCRGKVEVNPRELMKKDAEILGMVIMNAKAEERREIHTALCMGLTGGTLKPVIGAEIPLDEAARAHDQIIGSPACGKIVLIP